MKSQLVSIMMPVYNGERFIKQSIESVLAQTYSNWELIIVNDGSTDRTTDIVGMFTDPRIKLIHQNNCGEASARNTALKNMRGEYLAFLDADDLYVPHHLEFAVEYLSTYKQVDGVYTDGYYIDQDENRIQTLSSRRREPFEGNLFEEMIRSSDVFGAQTCVVLRTNLIIKYELEYDEDIVIGPDWDFFTKYADVGTFGYLDQTTCFYRLHTSNISFRTGLEKRALELAKCRINAVKMKSFSSCSVNVRAAVFYELLVNLLIDYPEQQSEITLWPEFINLPKGVRATLLRVMATKTMIYGKDQTCVRHWLDTSRMLNPKDLRATLLLLVFHINPKLLSMLLKIRNIREVDPRATPPFADMIVGNNH